MTTIQPAEQHDTAANGPTAGPAVAFLGTGRMGGPMAANLARGGLDVRVWNRTAARAAAIAADGAAVAASPAEAVSGARVVITMLADGPATEQAATGPDGFLAAAKGAIWVQMGTIGIEWTDRLGRHRRRAGRHLRRCPGLRQRGACQSRPAHHPGQRSRRGEGRTRPGVPRARPGHRLARPGG